MGFLSPNPAPAPPPRPKVVTTTGGRSNPGGGRRNDTGQADGPGSRTPREPSGDPSREPDPEPDPEPNRTRDRDQRRRAKRDRDTQDEAEADEASAEEGADPPLRRKNSGIQETVLTSSAGVLTERFDGPTRKRLLGG
jgi:hypothetical protein